MAKAHFSLSYAVETDNQTLRQVATRLDQNLAGQVKDLVAQALDGLEFDLQERYRLFTPEPDAETEATRPRSTQAITVWLSDEERFTEVQIGSADWFSLIEDQQKFTYSYEGLTFTVRFEERKSRGKSYYYWRAYATVDGKLVTKQVGKTDQLTTKNLDEVGSFFAKRS